ncbi:DUF6431 domain-containing protein [Lacrimispora amygdalina]|uniref:DUF6431 domain-containing protein n=1 Tax=Lacrimispora amygdalina TaxID=253257 RepID=UPI00114163D4|nr:DUF6431 domain-containing protein [Lacrimispora amygdalina]
MIRKNSLFCKIIRIKTSSKFLFLDFMRSFQPKTVECPICHSKGNCKIHASYSRSIIDIIHGKPVYQDICVTRIICESCGHSHAILPDTIIPYSQYGIFFILRVLAEYFTHLKTVASLCEAYNITPSMLYRWRDMFLQNRSVWLSILDQKEQLPKDFIRFLCLMEHFSDFSSGFFRLTGSSFLQSHANPTALFGRKHF